jgi:hypothetical protein
MALLKKEDVLKKLEKVDSIESLKIKIAEIISENNEAVLKAIKDQAPDATFNAVATALKKKGIR